MASYNKFVPMPEKLRITGTRPDVRVSASLEPGTPRHSRPPGLDAFGPDYPGSRPMPQKLERLLRDVYAHVIVTMPPRAA